MSVLMSLCVCLSVSMEKTEHEEKPHSHQLSPSFVVSSADTCKHRPKYIENFSIVVTEDLEKDEGTHTQFLSY